jgi:hypothetical protein
MVTPLEVGTAAAGFVGLAMQSFNGCIQAYELIQTARYMDHDGDGIRSKLLWQQKRLMEWGNRIQIDSNPLSDKLDWDLAFNLLKEQNEHLTSAEKIKAKYKLDVREEEVDESQIQKNDAGQSTLGQLLARVEQTLPDKKIKRTITRTPTLRGLQWAAIGKKQASRIVDDISEINDRLYVMLDSKDREWTQMVQEALLRNLISTSETSSELQAVQQLLRPQKPNIDNRIVAAAELKCAISTVRDRIPMALKKRLELTCIKHRKLGPVGAAPLADSGTVLGIFQKEQVLIEWRITDKEDWTVLKPYMQDLAVLLTTMDRNFFAVLDFRGLVRDRINRFALVYDLSPFLEGGSSEVKVTSLRQLIRANYNASLTCRLAIALRLAEAVLQFHTAGWLHKGIRSDNIIFISDAGASAKVMLEGNAYLIGFEHARPDSEWGKSLTRLPNTSLEDDLYRHPLARGTARQSFTKLFDLYSLGCVLLELARWDKLTNIHPDYQDLDKVIHHAEANGNVVKLPSLENWGASTTEVSLVAHAAGQIFVDVVALCFVVDEDGKLSPPLERQQKIVNKLRSCHL